MLEFSVNVDHDGREALWYLEAEDESKLLAWYRLDTWRGDPPSVEMVAEAIRVWRSRLTTAAELTAAARKMEAASE